MTVATPDLRTAMLDAAEAQLVASEDGEIATRAVCDAVGVTQPVLYRIFGDKRGLLDALADRGLERYAAIKATLPQTDDPIADLRAGWDDHTAFARANPALYQLMFVPRPWSRSTTREQVLALLEEALTRVAAVGALTTEPRTAATLVLSANVGFSLNEIARPDLFTDPTLSDRMRETVFSTLLVEDGRTASDAPVAAAARTLAAALGAYDGEGLEPEETALLLRWLQRLSAFT